MKPPYAIGSVPNLSGHAVAYRWRSLPRVRWHRASKPQGSSERVLPWQITMDQLIFASLSHTHYWYEVGMLKVPACRTCTRKKRALHARAQFREVPRRGRLCYRYTVLLWAIRQRRDVLLLQQLKSVAKYRRSKLKLRKVQTAAYSKPWTGWSTSRKDSTAPGAAAIGRLS